MTGVRRSSATALAAALAALGVLVVAPTTGDGTVVQGPVESLFAAPAAESGPAGRQVLEGPWAVKLDPENRGADRQWQTGAFAGQQVRVPYVPNARKLTGQKGIKGFRGTVAWYRTTFRTPTTGKFALRFESVHHHATVWLDGKLVKRHTGVYLPFEHRFRSEAGKLRTLVVRADYRGPTAQKRSGWHRTWFNFGGINREVSLRPVLPTELDTPQVQTRLQDDGSAQVDVKVHLRNRAGQSRRITVVGRLRRGDEVIDLPTKEVQVPGRGVVVVETSKRIAKPALWEPGSPSLYKLELGVPAEAGYVQQVGLREITWEGSRMYLNGKRLRLHGASLHEDVKFKGDALLPTDMDGLVEQLKQIGANSTRAQHQLHPALVERLDRAGMLTWMGIGPVDAPGSWTSKTPAAQRRARERARQSYFQLQPYASVLAWNLVNEIAGNGHPDGQIPYIQDMAKELHRRDPGKLVAVDVWGAHPPRGVLGPVYDDVDAIAVTNYAGWYEEPLSTQARAAQLIKSTTDEFRRTFKGKVIVISEFGAEANSKNPTDRPGGYGFQNRFLRQHISTYKAASGDVSGMLIWNLRDFAVSPAFAGGSIRKLVPGIKIVRGVNQKGLFDFEGLPKPSVEVVRQAFAPLGTGLTPAP